MTQRDSDHDVRATSTSTSATPPETLQKPSIRLEKITSIKRPFALPRYRLHIGDVVVRYTLRELFSVTAVWTKAGIALRGAPPIPIDRDAYLVWINALLAECDELDE